MKQTAVQWLKKQTLDIKEKALSSWENCDGCNENDKLFYINGYQKGYNQALADNKELNNKQNIINETL